MLMISQRAARLSYSIICAAFTFVALTIATSVQVQAQEPEYTFSKDVPQQTATFLTINPYTKASGSMTITFSGVFQAKRLNGFRQIGTSYISGDQNGTFVFAPDDPSQPTISGKFRFGLSGETYPQTDTIDFYFKMDGTTQDGSPVTFIQGEQAVVSEGALVITFGKTRRLVLENDSPDKPNDR